MSQSNENATNGVAAGTAAGLEKREPEFAVERANAEPETGIDWPVVRRLLDSSNGPAAPQTAQRLAIKTGGRLVFLDSGEIDWIEACGNYVRFHAGRESYLTRGGIGQLAQKLNPAEFIRVHRSTIVHIRKIKELQPGDNGEYILTLKDGKQLSCSRGYSAWLQKLIKNCYSI
jgi:two-component system LytT family response regulator